MSLSHPLIVVAIAVVVWWISTGLVLFAVRRNEGAGNNGIFAMMSFMTFIAAIGIAMLAYSKNMLTPLGSYMGFFGALLLWAWHEASFLSGVITGPRKGECPSELSQWGRFKAAWQAISSHELAILFTALLLYWLMLDAQNSFGFWTFMLLWVMRVSAKLIIFLGARNAMSDLMPEPVAHLKSYFNTTRTSPFFAFAVVAASVVFGLLVVGAYDAAEPYVRVGHVLLASFMALAIFEHFVLVLPISDTALWSWAVPRSKRQGSAPLPAKSNLGGGVKAAPTATKSAPNA